MIRPSLGPETCDTACPVCGLRRSYTLLDLGYLPAQTGVVHPDRQSAVDAPRGRMTIAGCTVCGHLYNPAFDSARVPYDDRYDADLHHSGVFRQYADTVARHLVHRFGLAGKTAVEIGSGSGHFLQDLRRHGVARAVGFDPAGRLAHTAGHVTTAACSTADVAQADMLCCRHVLEHVRDPRDLLGLLASARPGTPVYLEVPNATWMLTESGPWDVIYPHVSYFTADSMGRLLSQMPLRNVDIRTSYSDQFLSVEALVAPPGPPRFAPVGRHAAPVDLSSVARSLRRQQAAVQMWRTRLKWLIDAGERVVVWGAGSKGVTFLNLVDEARQVDAVVDINPSKRGKHVTGTGHRIAAPADVAERKPTTVVLMNPVYEGEVSASLTRLGINAEVLVV